jgi:hypothetical protein
MGKNIIICSDGTGKAGGTGDNTNVFELYRAVDIQDSNQITFYDDGIGSRGNKYLRTVMGVFGFGFKYNITKLYRYLSRHYEPGDKVYLFGFSRGAATVRALAGMIQTVGLLRNDSYKVLTRGRLDDIKVVFETMKAMRLYKRAKKRPKEAEEFKQNKTHGVIDIEMIGVWDTVSALGFPKDSSWLIIGISMLIDKISDYIFPHHYFNYQLDKNVKNVYHALAIDDDRYSFHPKVWNEIREDRPINIEQVWFSGAHSNVGGGYPRTGLSNITLEWMLLRARKHGIKFNEDMLTDIKGHPGDKLYYTREGVKVYYRIGPRHIRNLCRKNKKSILIGNIKIHSSVLQRISQRSYAPILPNKFEVVETDPDVIPIVYEENVDEVKKLKRRANLLLKMRVWMYHILTELSVITGLLIWYFNVYGSSGPSTSWTYNFIVEITPTFMNNLFYYIVYESPLVGILLALSFLSIFGIRKILSIFTVRTRKKINWWLLKNIK